MSNGNSVLRAEQVDMVDMVDSILLSNKNSGYRCACEEKLDHNSSRYDPPDFEPLDPVQMVSNVNFAA